MRIRIGLGIGLGIGVTALALTGCPDPSGDGGTAADDVSDGIPTGDDDSDIDGESGSTASTTDGETSTTNGESSGSTDAESSDDASSESSGNDESGIKWDLEPIPDSNDDCAMGGGGGGDDMLSFIWIANSSQGTVSKIDTMTGVEEGRYDSTPQSGGNPSRTSVNLLGDVAVSNRDPGGITKIAAHEDDCVDTNNNGMIDTSTGPNDVLAWGDDECVLWHTPTPTNSYGDGPRPTAWEGGNISEEDCAYDENPRLWVGFKDNADNGVFWRLDGETGDVLDEVNFGYWGSSFGPYGGAVNAEGDFIVTGLNTDPAIHIDSETLVVTNLGVPGTNCKYGMALDENGDVWVGHCFGEGMSHYSFENDEWTTLPNAGGTRVNGVMGDRDGNVWGAGSNPCRLVQVDVETKTYVNTNIPLPGGCSSPWGVSVDVEGYVWVVDMGSAQAYKVHPETYQTEISVAGLVGPYTYSDMTGAGLNLQVNPPG